ncbi:MAG: hypothetical protein LBC33_00205 [Mycoplasmataceae bacterium]|nr:hypothetical protein [Mycoplasmataceae bacterium]
MYKNFKTIYRDIANLYLADNTEQRKMLFQALSAEQQQMFNQIFHDRIDWAKLGYSRATFYRKFRSGYEKLKLAND